MTLHAPVSTLFRLASILLSEAFEITKELKCSWCARGAHSLSFAVFPLLSNLTHSHSIFPYENINLEQFSTVPFRYIDIRLNTAFCMGSVSTFVSTKPASFNFKNHFKGPGGLHHELARVL